MTTANQAARKAAGSFKKRASKGKTHILVLMDESGSMAGLEEAVVGGCNEFIHEFADVKNAHLWLAMFDHSPGEPRTRFKIRGLAAADVKALGNDAYKPRGMTPLNDAIADSVAVLDEVTDGDNDVVFLAIVTDGLENASETSAENTAELLQKREKTGWGIVFLGANQDSARTAADLGLHKRGHAFNFNANPEGIAHSMRTVSHLAYSRSLSGPGAAGLDEYGSIAASLHEETGGQLDPKKGQSGEDQDESK